MSREKRIAKKADKIAENIATIETVPSLGDNDDDLSDTDSDGEAEPSPKRPKKGGGKHEVYFVRKQIEHDTKQNIVSDYKNKMTIKYIMENYGISRRTIYKYVSAADKSQAIHQVKGRPKLIDDEGCARICEYYNNNNIKDVMCDAMVNFALIEANRSAEACRLVHTGSKELEKVDKISYTTLSRILSKGGCFNKKVEIGGSLLPGTTV